MASPLRRGTKIYFRKAVPKDLRNILGKAEIKQSLRTTDEEAARPEFARLNAEWEQRFQSLRRGVTRLSPKDIAALAGEFYKQMVDANDNDPDPDGLLRGRAAVDAWLAGDPAARVISSGNKAITDRMLQADRDRRRRQVETFLRKQGLLIFEDQLEPLVAAVSRMIHAAQSRLITNSEGRWPPDRLREGLPVWTAPVDRIAGPGQPVSKKYDILEIFDNMSRERGHATSTRDRWRPIVEKVAETHRDIRAISDEWCVQYKDDLVASGLSTKTIKEANLASLKNLFNFAVTNKLIPVSPMAGLTIKVKARTLLRQTKGYSDAEARVVLAATIASFSNLLPIDQHAARRWIPWLGYYSGARGGELAQLRKQDFRQENGIWLMHVDPEAGTVKSGEPRDVAVHPHLIEQGFIEFMLNCPRNTLFYDVSRKRVENAKNPPPVKTAENLAKWIRSLGLKDEQLQPNHGWRHRFTTMAREVDMDTVTCRYIQGHAPESEAEKYGNFPARVLLREIEKIPRFELQSD